MSSPLKVPFFDYPRLFSDDRENLLKIIEEVGDRGAYIMQKDLMEFESTLASYTDAQHAIGVANATDGMELAWMAIGLKPGDEVIISSHTMLATASAIVTAGGIPIPVEISSDNLIDPDAISDAITPRTVGISPTQLNGRTCQMDEIMKIAKSHKLAVVEDAAQALGSRFKGQHAGTFGDVGSFSFFPAKVLGCFGDGGGVITNSEDLYERIFQLHDHGRDTEGNHKSWGRNSRLDNLQAAILNHNFAKYEKVVSRRREIASMYQSLLGDIEQVSLPPAPDADLDHFDVYQNYELQAENRDALKQHLLGAGIGTLIQWGGKAIHQWDGLGFTQTLPKVEKFFEKCLMLPMNMFISDSNIEYVAKEIRSFYQH
jgi:dTDP-4-amino-4,6-dideoxygalactose transaminase